MLRYLVGIAVPGSGKRREPNGLNDTIAIDVIPNNRSLKGHSRHGPSCVQMNDLSSAGERSPTLACCRAVGAKIRPHLHTVSKMSYNNVGLENEIVFGMRGMPSPNQTRNVHVKACWDPKDGGE